MKRYTPKFAQVLRMTQKVSTNHQFVESVNDIDECSYITMKVFDTTLYQDTSVVLSTKRNIIVSLPSKVILYVFDHVDGHPNIQSMSENDGTHMLHLLNTQQRTWDTLTIAQHFRAYASALIA
jgi:hypothetical protein